MYGMHAHVNSALLAALAAAPLYFLVKWLYWLATGTEFPSGWPKHLLFLGSFTVVYFAGRLVIEWRSRR